MVFDKKNVMVYLALKKIGMSFKKRNWDGWKHGTGNKVDFLGFLFYR